ncbi:MAG: T9SS type A sorting domain-containing protein [Bacteroidia bacterium]|nr:T9SS type A sorting domain-containing protein [Bacteroidia bacterium]
MKQKILKALLLFAMLTTTGKGKVFAQTTPTDHWQMQGYTGLPYGGMGNWAAQMADLDNDGNLDIYLALEQGPDRVLLGNGQGNFGEFNISNESWNPDQSSHAIELKDLNGDGYPDFVIGRSPYNGGTYADPSAPDRLVLNYGNGQFKDITSYLHSETIDQQNYTMGVAVADFNADGFDDIVMVNGGVKYLINVETFTPVNWLTSQLDEKMQNDLYLGNPSQPTADSVNQFYSASVSSGFGLVPDLATDVIVRDFNGDGYPDIFVSCFYHKPITAALHRYDSSYYQCKLYLNDAQNPGHFTWDRTMFPDTLIPATSVDAGDFNGDGTQDLLITTESRAKNPAGQDFTYMKSILYQNAANTIFIPVQSFSSTSTGSTSSFDGHLADFNNDGKLDVFCAGISSMLFLQNSASVFVDRSDLLPLHPAGNQPFTFQSYGAATGDVDHNGMRDIVLMNTFEQVRLHLQLPNGKFVDTTSTNLPPDGEDTQDALLADLDGDGDLDVFKVNLADYNNPSLYLQNGLKNGYPWFGDHGNYVPHQGISENRGVSSADADGDGDLDLLVSGVNGLKLYRNDGSNIWTDVTTAWLPTGFMNLGFGRAEFVDYDGNNQMEIFLPAENIWLNNKMLQWNPSTQKLVDKTSLLPSDLFYSGRDVAFADINNDGKQDFVVANYQGKSFLYYSNPAGNAYSRLELALSLSSVACAFGDVDGDGYDDIVLVTKSNTQPSYVYFRNPAITSTPTFNPYPISGTMDENAEVALWDLDQNGAMEIILAGRNKNQVFSSNPSRTFTDQTTFYFPNEKELSSAHAVRLADMNNDGVVDVYFARDNQDVLFYGVNSVIGGKTRFQREEPEMVVWPNPASKTLNLRLFLEKSGSVNLALLDEAGRVVMGRSYPDQRSGNLEITLDLGQFSLQSGIYILKTEGPAGVTTRKIIVQKP